jgi:integrase/recombinase XerD
MVDYLFPRLWARYVAGPCGMLVRDFATWVVERGYTRICARGHVRRFRRVLTHNKVLPKPSRLIAPTKLARWFAPWADEPLYRGTRRLVARFFDSRSLFVPASTLGPFDSLVAEYRSYLFDQRGFSSSTVNHHVQTVSGFLKDACPRKCGLSRLSQERIERFVDRVSRRRSRQSLQQTVAHLRAFLRFCADHGRTRERLDIIDTPRAHRGELPPRALRWNVVRKLLGSIDRSSVAGCRDHAILYLMAYYGLRPAEIADLTVDSINWENGTLRVQQRKTRSVMILPLNGRAMRVLYRYLRTSRPEGPWRELFLRVRCPAGPIKAATITDIYANRALLSGLPIDGSSAYSLRHSFAMRLLERGVGVKAIGDLLGHRSFESTCVYLRLHVDALREVALPVPRAVGLEPEHVL